MSTGRAMAAAACLHGHAPLEFMTISRASSHTTKITDLIQGVDGDRVPDGKVGIMELGYDEVKSPLGTIVLVTNGGALCSLDFADCRERMMSLMRARYGDVRLKRVRDPGGSSSRVRAYLQGDLRALERIPVDTGGTAFQRKVWSALRRIPAGTTCSYGELAAAVGRPSAARAVGASNGRNPIALVIPCHRVVGSDGSLIGYAGGVERKRWLLAHEGVDQPAAD